MLSLNTSVEYGSEICLQEIVINRATNPTNKISRDLFLHIAEFCDFRDIHCFARVNRNYCQILNASSPFWKVFAKRNLCEDIAHYNDIGKQISNYNEFCKIRRLFQKALIKKQYSEPSLGCLNFNQIQSMDVCSGNIAVSQLQRIVITDLDGRLIRDLKSTHQIKYVKIHGTYLISVAENGNIHVQDINSGNLLKEYTVHVAPVNALVLFNQTTVSCSKDGVILHWDLMTGETIKRLREGPGAIYTVVKNSNQIAAAGIEGIIQIWDISNFDAPPITLRGQNGVKSLLFFNDKLVSARNGGIDVWDLASGEVVWSYSTREHQIVGLESLHGYIIAGSSKKIEILDPLRIKPVVGKIYLGMIGGEMRMKLLGEKILYHSNFNDQGVYCLDFSAKPALRNRAFQTCWGQTKIVRKNKCYLVVALSIIFGVIALACLIPRD